MEFRTLRSDEKEKALNLGEFAFQQNFTDEERREILDITQPENIWGAFDGDRLTSKVSLLPLNVWLHGKSLPACGVTGVSTWPEQRRGGLVRQLIFKGLEDMRARGHLLALLDPFAISYYRKFGWELYCDETIAELKKEHFPTPAKNGSGTFTSLEKEDWAVFAEIYSKYASRFSGMIDRDEWWWTNLKFNHFTKTKKRRNIVYTNDQGENAGYILYTIKDELLKVLEFVALNEDAERELWRFIAYHDSMAEKITVKLPNNEPWRFFMNNPAALEKREAFFMARIVDAEAFLNAFPFELQRGETLTIAINDDFADWNTGTFVISNEGVVRDDQETVEMKADIRALVPLMFRYVDGQRLRMSEEIQTDEETMDRWLKAIPHHEPNLFDAF